MCSIWPLASKIDNILIFSVSLCSVLMVVRTQKSFTYFCHYQLPLTSPSPSQHCDHWPETLTMAIIINTVTVKNEPKWRQISLCRDDIDMCYCLGHNISGDQGNLVTSDQWSVPYDAGEAGHRAEQKLIYCSWLLVTFFPISIMSIGSGIENNIAEAWSNTISNGNTCVRDWNNSLSFSQEDYRGLVRWWEMRGLD